jgi:hypothetical protein
MSYNPILFTTKSHFFRFFVTDIPVYIQSQEQSDFSGLHQQNITFLSSDFTVTQDCFTELANNSFVVLDDFSFNTQQVQKAKTEFLKVVNYYLRHHNIKLCLVIHNLFNNNLFTEILLAPHLFLSYSNLGYYVIR